MLRVRVLLACGLGAVLACSSTSPSASGGGGPDGGASPEGGGEPSASQCTSARKTHLVPIGRVSTGEVKVVSTEGGVTTIFVDASAGGALEVARNPRVYIKLSGERVDIDDDAAFTSAEWDLALKRVDIFTNSGDAGPGKGGAALIQKEFDDVTAADADAATISPEKFFDEECVGRKDEAEFIVTTFSGWYDYAVGAGPSVKPGVSFVTRAADGSRYKVAVASYTGQADGGTENPATGFFLLKVAPL